MHAGRRSFAPLPPLSSHPSPDDHELFKDFAAVSPRKRSNPRFRRPPPPRFESSAPPSHGEGEATTGVRPVPQGSATRVLHLNAGHLKLSGCVLSLSLSRETSFTISRLGRLGEPGGSVSFCVLVRSLCIFVSINFNLPGHGTLNLII